MGQAHPIRPPRSRILVAGCTRSWAIDRIRRGYAPKGSIWYPGSFDRRPELGDLFAPDPDWRPPNLKRKE